MGGKNLPQVATQTLATVYALRAHKKYQILRSYVFVLCGISYIVISFKKVFICKENDGLRNKSGIDCTFNRELFFFS